MTGCDSVGVGGDGVVFAEAAGLDGAVGVVGRGAGGCVIGRRGGVFLSHRFSFPWVSTGEGKRTAPHGVVAVPVTVVRRSALIRGRGRRTR